MSVIRNNARSTRECHADNRIMVHWDNGMTTRQIHEALGISESRVRTVVASLSFGRADRWQKDAVTGSIALAARILEVHGVMA